MLLASFVSGWPSRTKRTTDSARRQAPSLHSTRLVSRRPDIVIARELSLSRISDGLGKQRSGAGEHSGHNAQAAGGIRVGMCGVCGEGAFNGYATHKLRGASRGIWTAPGTGRFGLALDPGRLMEHGVDGRKTAHLWG